MLSTLTDDFLPSQVDFAASYLTHPRDNQNEGFRFSARHSEFVQVRGQRVPGEAHRPPGETLVVQYPDMRFQYMAAASEVDSDQID